MKFCKYCVHCGVKLLKKSKNCPQCGKSFKNMYFLNEDMLTYVDYIKKRQKHELEYAKTLLTNDEIMFLHSTHAVHVLKDIKGLILLGAFLQGVFLIFMIIGHYVNSLSTEPSRAYAIGTIIVTLALSPLFLYPLIKGFYKYWMILKHYNLPRSELRNYIEVSCLTNKRWVQKSLEAYKKIYTLYPMKRKNDMLFTDPKNIHLRYSEIESYSSHYVKIETFLNPNENAPEPLKLSTTMLEPETFKNTLIEMKKRMEIKFVPINKFMGSIYFKDTYNYFLK